MKRLIIKRDCDPQNPRAEWDNLATMVCAHRRYDLGDVQADRVSLDLVPSGAEYLRLYLLDHGGITISTEPFKSHWDSGHIGYIYVRKEDIKNELEGSRERALEVMRGEVSVYDEYLQGNVWGYVIKEVCECCGQTTDNVIDSCYGFFGDDKEGIAHHLPDDVKDQLDKAWEDRFEH